MKYTADALTPDAYVMYRLYRFGLAGRCGRDGAAAAAAHHGVGPRVWFMYESGARRPKLEQRQRIARWLNAGAAVVASDPVEDTPPPSA